MSLDHAITTLLLIRVREPALFPRAAAELLARMLKEIQGLTLSDAGLLVDAFVVRHGELARAQRDFLELLTPHREQRLAAALRSPPSGSPPAWRWSRTE